ncbi:Mitochondrial dicarboxylate carrier [Larimichthys crocea]|uniref:Uncharacterized protein n=1 Tax=Larimichthys crocea TaxID=215358 RepID=A0ACD3RU88_LARCR|nr:Mitochondrial dicarboxylate carrier [Larimichthys crocea]
MAEKRMSRWYFGGLASSAAACCTHPLDLIKVHLQTQQEVKKRMVGMAIHVVKTDGVLALYNGLSASLCRQGVSHCLRETAKLGPLAFYKGLVPAGIRLIPHTVLTFVFLEQLKKYFGIRIIS